MSAVTGNKRENARKPSFKWKRRTNTVPLTERGVFKLPEAADYLSQSISRLRRLISRHELHRLPGSRHILIARAECDRWIREQTDIAKLGA